MAVVDGLAAVVVVVEGSMEEITVVIKGEGGNVVEFERREDAMIIVKDTNFCTP